MAENNCNHDHDHDCNCGENCGCNHTEQETVKLTLEDNTELECEIIGTFDVEDQEYIALLPLEEEDVLIYKFKDVNGEIELSLIEEDEEFERVSEAFFDFFDDSEDEEVEEEN